jgi:asparagine synthetase B (glutamine-hydrolysing)
MQAWVVDPKCAGNVRSPDFLRITKGRGAALRLENSGAEETFFVCDGSRVSLSTDPRAVAGGRLRIRPGALADYLRLGWVPPPETIWRDVRVLASDWSLVWNGARWCAVSGFRPPHFSGMPDSPGGLRSFLQEATDAAAKGSDRIATSLSAGIDSLSVAIALLRRGQKRAFTFSTCESNGEGEEARRIGESLGLDVMVVHQPSGSVVTALLPLTKTLAQPLSDPALLAHLWVAQAAASSCSRLLTGDGAEGLLGEFYFKPDDVLSSFSKRASADALSWFGYEFQMDPEQIRRLVAPAAERPVEEALAAFRSADRAHQLSCRSDVLLGGARFDHNWWIPANVQRRNDAVARITGVRTLCPFADLERRWPRLAFARPKLYERPKEILRSALRRELGDFADQPKRSYRLPVSSWLTDCGEEADELLAQLPDLTDGVLKAQSLEDLLCSVSPRGAFAVVALASFLGQHPPVS